MQSIQIGNADHGAGLPVSQRLFFVKADPDCGGDRGSKADEPRIREIVRGSGFPSQGPSERFCRCRRTALHDILKQSQHLLRDLGFQDLVRLRSAFFFLQRDRNPRLFV